MHPFYLKIRNSITTEMLISYADICTVDPNIAQISIENEGDYIEIVSTWEQVISKEIPQLTFRGRT